MPIWISNPDAVTNNLRPAVLNSWETVSITSQVGGFSGSVKAALIRVYNNDTGIQFAQLRAAGSTDNRIDTVGGIYSCLQNSQHERWVGGREAISAGLIAGAAILGIGDILVRVFLL